MNMLPWDSWEYRESLRFLIGTYQAVPDLGPLFAIPPEHYLHLSLTHDNTTDVAYTPSAEYGQRDRQVTLKLGRYLKKTFPSVSDIEIGAAVDRVRVMLAVVSVTEMIKFTTDADVISDIFETKLTARDSSSCSCMYGKFTDLNERPYHVYADSPDVAVAYMINSDNGRIIARSVVATKTMKWIRTYAPAGDRDVHIQFEHLLALEGYTEGTLLGCRLSHIVSEDSREILPYLDGGEQNVELVAGNSITGDMWRVTRDGDYTGDRVDGYASDHVEKCESCNEALEDCNCYYCDCCETRSPDGCDECRICESCEQCVSHDDCSCSRCGLCTELLLPPYLGNCRCEKCPCCDTSIDSRFPCERCVFCADCSECIKCYECICEKCNECRELINKCSCVPIITEMRPDESIIT